MTTDILPRTSDSLWFSEAKYGVFVHFLPSGKDFQREVNAVDVHAFASDCVEAGAGYAFWTLGQNSGYFCAPNATYDRYAGRKAGDTCSTRDLPQELAEALAIYKIPLLLYAPGDPPAEDTRAAYALGAMEFRRNFNGENWVFNDTLVERWSEVIAEWAKRYGDTVVGWWFDGCYRESDFTDAQAAVLSRAVKQGNPDALVAFNTGLNYDKVSDSEDFLAGEANDLFGGRCENRLVEGAQWHELSFLGSGWSNGAPRCTAIELIAYLKDNVIANGGVLTLDVPQNRGRIDPAHLQILKAVKAANQ